MSNFEDIFALQQLVARFANSFDTKDWTGLGQCVQAEIDTDYSDLRGTPPERMSRDRFVELRRTALHDLQTHHLSGNAEINISNTCGEVKASMVIYRRNANGETLNTHCMYVFGGRARREPLADQLNCPKGLHQRWADGYPQRHPQTVMAEPGRQLRPEA
ncbi:MAG: nuclear transport factor 2 family protein [Burkholderiales bacterium]